MELMPLLDVVFLLLTFFIFSWVITTRVEVLPVRLMGLPVAEAAEPGRIHALTINSQGQLFYDREPITHDALDAKLAELASDPNAPMLFLAVEDESQTDRAPLLIELVGKVKEAGLQRFGFVGPRPVNEPGRDAQE